MNNTACPRCTQDLCEDCFNDALLSIDSNTIAVARKYMRGTSLDDQLELARAKAFIPRKPTSSWPSWPRKETRERWNDSRRSHYKAWAQSRALHS